MSTYLIIGASSGIGKKLAENLVYSGHRVIATFFNNKPENIDGLPEYHYLNVLDENIPLDFLPDTLDGLVYCPGSINLRPFERIKPVDFAADFNLQVTKQTMTISDSGLENIFNCNYEYIACF